MLLPAVTRERGDEPIMADFPARVQDSYPRARG